MLVRKQRRVGGRKYNYWLDTATGIEYDRKPVRQARSDRKPVSQNNVVIVALSLLERYEVPLVTMLEAVYRDTGDTEVLNQLRLIGATKDALSELVFLAGFCQPSQGLYSEKAELALQVAYKFILEIFPEELENVSNSELGVLRTRRVGREYVTLDDGTDSGSEYHFAGSAVVDALPLQVR